MAEIDIKVSELNDALVKMVSAMKEFETLKSNFSSSAAGSLDDMNSDFMGIARKTLSHINDSMLSDISESLEAYCSGVNSLITEFESTDTELADGIKSDS